MNIRIVILGRRHVKKETGTNGVKISGFALVR